MTREEYLAWRLDTSRDDHRVFCVELDYAAGQISAGHGRRNSEDTLNEVLELELFTYAGNAPTFGELTFRQPRSQAGYSWEIWRDGAQVTTITSGSYQFNAPADSTVSFAVASVKADGSYSKPAIGSIVMNNTDQTVAGYIGDWSDVGDGAGIEGVETVRLSSRAYLDEPTNTVFDDWLETGMALEESLDNFFGVGDLTAVNPDPDGNVDWLAYRWRGHEVRLSGGDETWPFSEFRLIASAINGGCKLIDDIRYQFDLVDGGQRYKRTFLDADYTATDTAEAVIADIVTRASLSSATYVDVPAAHLASRVLYAMDDTTRAGEAIRRVAMSIGARVRVTRAGALEVFIPDLASTPVVTLTEDDVVADGVRMTEVEPAYRRIVVKRSEGAQRGTATTALTGVLDEAYVADTVLRDQVDADRLVASLAGYYAAGHATWEIDVIGMSELVEVGDVIAIEHETVTGVGLVTRMVREPLSDFSAIEIMMETETGT